MENLNWLSLLEYYAQENIAWKDRLTAVVEGKMNSSDLEKAEYFQNEFLKKDEIINILRNQIIRQEQQLSLFHEAAEATLREDILRRQESLRSGMCFLETEMAVLEATFEHYLIARGQPS